MLLSLESAWQDARYASRQLAAAPGLSLVLIVVLAAVIGLNTTLFAVVTALAFRPLGGVADPTQLIALYLTTPRASATGFSIADYRAIADSSTSLSGVAALRPELVRLGENGSLGAVGAFLVSGNAFDLLGVRWTAGRSFHETDDRPNTDSLVTVIGYRLWETRFGRDPDLVGSTIRINGLPFRVLGVTAPDFRGFETNSATLFMPMSAAAVLHASDGGADFLTNPVSCCADIVARLRPGIAREQARAELDTLAGQLPSQVDATPRVFVVTGTEFLSRPGRSEQILNVVALTAAGLMLVWLLACANLGNLLLAKASARGREIGVRLALGASRARIVRQLLTEGFVLALIAATVGVALAYWLPRVLLQFATDGGDVPFDLTPDGRVLLFAVVVAAFSTLAFGLAPALHATRADVSTALHHDAAAVRWSRLKLRGVLLGAQVAVSVVLLTSAALLIRGIQHQAGAFEPGFAVDDVSVVSFDLPIGAYDEARMRAFIAQLASSLEGAANVRAFGFASQEPLALSRTVTSIHRSGEATEQDRQITYFEVSPGYFDTLRIPLAVGRGLEAADSQRPVVLVNEAMARQYWPGDDPVGKTVILPDGPHEIVGVVRDAYMSGLNGIPPLLFRLWSGGRRAPKLLIRTPDAAGVAQLVTGTVARLDPQARVQTTSLAAIVDDRLASTRYGPTLAGVLGIFALTLASVGIFGVFSYAVRQRTREIGIRMALGARRAAVIRIVLSGHFRALLGGLVLGSAGAVAASLILRSYLHGLSPFDPLAYLSVAAAVVAAAIAASYVPARRATRIDPIAALRRE